MAVLLTDCVLPCCMSVFIAALQPKGTKAEMALRVLSVFGLKAATSAPVQLLRLVKMEKSRRLAWDGPDASSLHSRVNTAIDQFALTDEDSWKRVKFARVRKARSCCVLQVHGHAKQLYPGRQAGAGDTVGAWKSACACAVMHTA